MPKDQPPGSITDQQLVRTIRALLHAQEGAGVQPVEQNISIGEVIGNIIDVVEEIVLQFIEDVTELVPGTPELVGCWDTIDCFIEADVVDVVNFDREVVVHLVVDVLLDMILNPLEAGALKTKGLTGVAEERLARAQVALQIASQKSTAPSSRELAVLRKVLLQSKAKKAQKT